MSLTIYDQIVEQSNKEINIENINKYFELIDLLNIQRNNFGINLNKSAISSEYISTVLKNRFEKQNDLKNTIINEMENQNFLLNNVIQYALKVKKSILAIEENQDIILSETNKKITKCLNQEKRRMENLKRTFDEYFKKSQSIMYDYELIDSKKQEFEPIEIKAEKYKYKVLNDSIKKFKKEQVLFLH